MHVEAVLGQVDVVVVVDALSCTSQPTITLLVESTCVAVVFAADTAHDVVVRNMVADSVPHEVGSSEYVGTSSLPILYKDPRQLDIYLPLISRWKS